MLKTLVPSPKRPWPERRHQHGNSTGKHGGGRESFLQVKMEHTVGASIMEGSS